ncbi:ASPIC/UnbV domain-containing protein [Planctomycetota bacterium]
MVSCGRYTGGGNAGGSFGANPLRQMICLGSTKTVEELRVYWPISQTTQLFKNVTINRQFRVVEGARRIEDVTLQVRCVAFLP